MRMGIFLEAYARRFEVTLVVLPLSGEGPVPSGDMFAQQHAHRIIDLPLDRAVHPLFSLIARHRDAGERRAAMRKFPRPRSFYYDPVAARGLLADRLGGESFALVHAGRLCTAPLVEAYFGKARCILDADEDDARTLRRIAKLLRANGEEPAAADHEAEAAKYEVLAEEYLPRFGCCVVAGADDAASLRDRYRGAVLGVIANAVRIAEAAAGSASNGSLPGAFDLLMVGSLGYYPNTDGVLFFAREILPLLAPGGPPLRLAVVGSKPSAAVRALGDRPGITVAADVDDVAPYYAASRIAVVPIRAGGGSRIKILEAFSHGVPVVSTRIGAEGLAAIDGRHLLLADTAEEFAEAIGRLMADPGLAARLAGEGRGLIEERYSLARVAADIEALADPPPGVIECSRQ